MEIMQTVKNMEFQKKVKVGGAMAVGTAVTAVMLVEPTTLLGKCACILVASALGGMVADPLQKKMDDLESKLAELNEMVDMATARMSHASVPAG